MDERKLAEKRVEELQGLVQTIEEELAQARGVLVTLGGDREAAMVEALERGRRANIAGKTAAMAREREKIEGLVAEREVVQNILAHAEEALAPFLIRERLLEAVQEWERQSYTVKALYDRRGDNWDALRDYHKASWERDEVGLRVLVDAGVAPEEALRRHRGESEYLAGLDHYPVFGGLYPECVIVLRRLQRELQGSEVELPKIARVSGVAVAQALGEPVGDSINRRCRFKAFQDFYIPDRPDESPYDELRGGVVFQYVQ